MSKKHLNRPQHKKASYWINKGVFDGLITFSQLSERINKLRAGKDRGDVFEIFIEAYLETQLINQCVEHWVVGNMPKWLLENFNLPLNDTGIDGVYKTFSGEFVAYQVKYRRSQTLSFREVATFLSISDEFEEKVIFSTADTLRDIAGTRSRFVGGYQFRDLSSDAFAEIIAWLKQVPAPLNKLQPDPRFQVKALSDIATTFEKHTRAHVVMACGTGKTLVALWATEAMEPKKVLVLLPSLALLQQTLKMWCEQTSWALQFSYICVCSDPTVDLENDEIYDEKNLSPFKVNTNPQNVRNFLDQKIDKIKVVFCTYDSSNVVGAAVDQRHSFDVGIFDEAHRTVGSFDSKFSYALLDKNIPIKKRLFLTATPKTFQPRKRNKQGDIEFSSMDNANYYGPRAFTFTFDAAVKKGVICPFEVIISVINREILEEFDEKHGYTAIEGDTSNTDWISKQVALQRAINLSDSKKIITFHGRVRRAQLFARDSLTFLREINPLFKSYHVNGRQETALRKNILDDFEKEDHSLLTNSRCLNEGVDIPTIDMVAFMDPKHSKIDIIQSIGRAVRKPRNDQVKEKGYIFIPISLDTAKLDEIEEKALEEQYDTVVDVVNAIQSHDNELSDTIVELTRLSATGVSRHKPFGKWIKFIGPKVSIASIEKAIEAKIIEDIGEKWDFWFGLLDSYISEGRRISDLRKNHYKGYDLYKWISHQRTCRRRGIFGYGPTSDGRREASLNSIGFIWEPKKEKLLETVAELIKYKKKFGTINVPQGGKYNSLALRLRKIRQQRERFISDTEDNKAKHIIDNDIIKNLEDHGIIWRINDEDWKKGFLYLFLYFQFKEK